MLSFLKLLYSQADWLSTDVHSDGYVAAVSRFPVAAGSGELCRAGYTVLRAVTGGVVPA